MKRLNRLNRESWPLVEFQYSVPSQKSQTRRSLHLNSNNCVPLSCSFSLAHDMCAVCGIPPPPFPAMQMGNQPYYNVVGNFSPFSLIQSLIYRCANFERLTVLETAPFFCRTARRHKRRNGNFLRSAVHAPRLPVVSPNCNTLHDPEVRNGRPHGILPVGSEK